MCRQIPILTYHRVHPDDEMTEPGDLGRVDLTMFRRQMHHLAKLGLQTVTHHEIAAWLYYDEPVPQRAVALDFDDNRYHIFEHAFPIMAELGFCGTVFVVTDLAEGNPNIRYGMDRFPVMDWDHLRQLHEAGWCISPHTLSHPIMAGPNRMVQDDVEIRREMTESLRLVEQRIGPLLCLSCWSLGWIRRSHSQTNFQNRTPLADGNSRSLARSHATDGSVSPRRHQHRHEHDVGDVLRHRRLSPVVQSGASMAST